MLDYAGDFPLGRKSPGNLQRIGGMTEIPMEPIVGMENPVPLSRSKAQFPIGQDRNGKLIAGIFAGKNASDHGKPELLSRRGGQNEEILNRILAGWRERRSGIQREDQQRPGAPCADPVWIADERDYEVCLVVNEKRHPSREKLIKSLTELEGMTSIT